MAKAFPHLDANGKFAGCKLPIYPLCKLCPGQQVCPVDCIPLDPENVESEDELMEKYERLQAEG